MFRRKEDDYNDSDPSAQGSLLSSESVKVLNPEAVPYGSSGSSSSSGNYSSGGASRSAAADLPSRQAGSGLANSFRSVNSAEISRSRTPEAKSPTSFTASPASSSAPRESRRVLTVGTDILLKGEIATCDRLVIEGKVDAVLNDVTTIELAESGSFKGIAHIENAEISGLFEGELVVKGRLVVYASGRVRGKITYGEIEIERGGEISGEVKTIAAAGASRNNRPDKSLKDAAAA